MEGGREQNYWPGFVDALSNVVLTLVFVLVIFVFALVMASNKVQQKMDEVAQQTKDKVSQQVSTQAAVEQQKAVSDEEKKELQQQIAQMQSEIDNLKQANIQLAAEKAATGATAVSAVSDENKDMQIEVKDKEVPKVKQGAIQIASTAENVTINYPLAVADMDDKSSSDLGHVLDAMKKKTGNKKVLLRSIMGKEPFSAARRLAYYRAISARNLLITKGIADASNITSVLVKPPTPEDGRVEIVFQNK